MMLVRIRNCPSCNQAQTLVGAEWWHERPHVRGLHPRDCKGRDSSATDTALTPPNKMKEADAK